MKSFEGTVISAKMIGSSVVSVDRQFRHPMYGKIIRKKKKIHAVNGIGAREGQRVRVNEVRPISKTISFRIMEIINLKEGKKSSSLVKGDKTKE